MEEFPRTQNEFELAAVNVSYIHVGVRAVAVLLYKENQWYSVDFKSKC